MPGPVADTEMQDAPGVQLSSQEDYEQEEEINPETEKNRIRVLQGSTDTAASFQFDEEDHTLGNALRYIIMKNPDVEFCGYSIPHPAEDKMNLRIQTYDGVNVHEVLEKGLKDLEDMCDVVLEKFVEAKQDWDERLPGLKAQA